MLIKVDTPFFKGDESIFFARELNKIMAEVYEEEQADLQAIDIFPITTRVPDWALTFTYEMYTKVGIAKFIASYADDLPRADVKGSEVTANVRDIGAAYGYSLKDIRQARALGKPLENLKARSARRAIEELIDRTAWFGDSAYGIQGFFSNPNVTKYVVDDNAGGTSGLWANKTGAEIVADMFALTETIITLTKGRRKPDTLLLPMTSYNYITRTQFQSGSDTTILTFFKNNCSYIKNIVAVPLFDELTTALVGGGDSMKVMAAFRSDPEVLSLEVPKLFEQLPPEARNMEFVINCLAATAGVQIRRPLEVAVAEGI